MATHLNLQELPVEVVEMVVQQLDHRSCGTLRLANWRMARKVSQGSFQKQFHFKRINLTKEGLEHFAKVPPSGQLGCTVRDIVLVGIANGGKKKKSRHQCTNEDMAEFEQEFGSYKYGCSTCVKRLREIETKIKLLKQGFRSLASSGSGLRSLTMEVLVKTSSGLVSPNQHRKESQVAVWKTAARVFEVTVMALAQTHLPIDALNIFSTQQRCSLAYDEVYRIMVRLAESKLSFQSSLKQLTINLSAPTMTDLRRWQRRTGVDNSNSWFKSTDLRELMEVHDLLDGFPAFLLSFPSLEKLEINWTTLRHWRIRRTDFLEERLLTRIGTPLSSVPRLTSLVVRGMCATESGLISLLENRPIRHLLLANIHLREGTFRGIFDHCTSNNAIIESLHFDDLFEINGSSENCLSDQTLLYFNHGNQPRSSSFSVGGKTSSRESAKAHDFHPIEYDLANVFEGPKSADEVIQWHQLKVMEYGPPCSHIWLDDFDKVNRKTAADVLGYRDGGSDLRYETTM